MSRRVTGEDDILIDGFKVSPGTNVIMLNYHLHRDETQFQDPHQFNPDRFENSRQNYSFLPFSAGPRNCIGQK